MNLKEFLSKSKDESFWNANKIICFKSTDYPLLFFRCLFDFLRAKKVVDFKSLGTSDTSNLYKTLHHSFLGQISFYWLGDIQEVIKNKKGRDSFIKFLKDYEAENIITFFSSYASFGITEHRKASEDRLEIDGENKIIVVEIPEKIYSKDLTSLLNFFDVAIPKRKFDLISVLLNRSNVKSLDMICMLLKYVSVTNIKMIDELQKELENIIDPDISLFDLAQEFFKKDSKKFFGIWKNKEKDFPEAFWISFWSEQIWRAYHVVKYFKLGDQASAKRFSYRLPFSFLNRDWRTTSLKELRNAYEFVYEIDYHMKTGSKFCYFDLFYSKYFLGKFAEV